MRRSLSVLALVVGSLILATPASAHTLTTGEARTNIKRTALELPSIVRYGYMSGTYRSSCWRRDAHRVRCSITLLDQDGDRWTGTGWTTLRGSELYYGASLEFNEFH